MAEKGIDSLEAKATKCKYNEKDRRLKGHKRHNDLAMTDQIIKELTVIKNLSEVVSKWVLLWPKCLEA